MTTGDSENTSPATVKVSFALPVAGGSLNASASVPAGRTNLTELLPLIQNLENAIIGKIAQEADEAGSPISCRAGCGACCRQLVPVSLFEAEALMNWMATLPPQRRADIEQRFHQALLKLRDSGVIDKILDQRWANDEQLTTQLAIDYFHAGVACPFLENESCSIHPMRPLSCREYLVTSPPALCDDPSVNQVSGVRLPLKLSRVLYSFGQQMTQERRGWIPLVFLLASQMNGAKPGEFVSGTGEEVLRKFLERVTETPQAEDGQPAVEQAGRMA
ncbi:MAG: YkgJ family cysteine cluster protein [Acidobacteriaceae bacterium]